MGTFSIWHWVIVLLFVFLTIWPAWRVAKRAGYSGAWSLTLLVPLVNLIVIWVFALSKWPTLKKEENPA